MHDSLWKSIVQDLWRVGILFALGAMFIAISTPLARWVGEPAFSPWGLFFGGSFLIAGLSHIIRRLFFYPISMHKTGEMALGNPIGAGLVFLGICLVLSAFVLVMGAMIRV